MKNKQTITNTLFSKLLVKEVIPSVEEIIKRANKKKVVKLIYGETYDRFGLTIDSLKYYFYLSLLHKELEELGFKVISNVIIGDLHSVKNQNVVNKDELLDKASDRLKFLKEIKAKYSLRFEPVLMSQLFKQNDFPERREATKRVFEKTPECKEIAQKTVLKNRLTQEEKAGYQYTIEEVTLIMGYDIKIGPPREVFFDQLARMIASRLGKAELCGIYLKPTYPLGLGFDYFIQHPEIEEYGLTPYKAGSNQLQSNRVILDKGMRNTITEFMVKSFIPKSLKLPNPLLDLLLITDLAKSCLTNSLTLSDYQVLVNDTEELKNKLLKQLELYIYQPLNL